MANTVNGNINLVTLNSTILTQNYYPVRNIFSKVPPAYQTEEMNKFFNSTINYWFTPGEASTYNGYIGELTEWYNPITDHYITEESNERTFYQLNPSITIKDTNNDITKVVTYVDIINNLMSQGCNVENQDRLFSNRYWSWCPPIDIDKFINYGNYYWISDLDNYFLLSGIQEKYYVISSNLSGIDGYTSINNSTSTLTLQNENISVSLNGNIIPDAMYVVTNNTVTFNNSFDIGDKIVIYYQSDIDNNLLDYSTVEPLNFGLNQLNNGMRVKILNDVNSMYNGKYYIVSGIGSSISLYPDENFTNIMGSSMEYTYSSDVSTYKIDQSMYVDGMNSTYIKVYVDGIELPTDYYTYSEIYDITINVKLNDGAIITIYTPSNIEEYFGEYVTNIYGINVKRNQIINITNDINSEYNGTYMVTYNSDLFGIEEYTLYYDPDYITIDKRINNPWSLKNRWFHKDNINISIDQTTKATRPIIEFDNDIILYNYGTYRRLDTDFVNTSKTDISSIDTTNNIGVVDGVRIDEEYIATNGGFVRILLTNDINSYYNNKIISVWFNSSTNQIDFFVNNDGENQSGIPVSGEITKILNGNNANSEYYYNGSSWVKAQSKGTFPLFNLYDDAGIALNDVTKYPNSSFTGNTIFSYEEGTGSDDSVLDFPLLYNADGNIMFSNSINNYSYTYVVDNITYTLSGIFYYMNNNVLGNCWHESSDLLRQTLTNTYKFDGVENSLELVCPSYDSISVQYVNVDSTYPPYVSTTTDYTINEDRTILTLNFTPNNGDIIIVQTTCFDSPMGGYYDLPDCMTVNPDNEIISSISLNECYTHFNEIIDESTWLTSTPDYSKGKEIILQMSDMMTLGLLSTDTDLDFIASSEYVKKSYNQYKTTFQKLLYDYYTQSKFLSTDTTETMCQKIISIISQGKVKNSPFYNTGFGKTSTYNQETFIPTTPSMEGLYPVYYPEMIDDRSLPIKDNGCYQTFIKCHDGSLILTYGDYSIDNGIVTNVTYNQMDDVLLELETRIYNTINSSFVNNRPVSDYIAFKPSYFRDAIYTYEEYNSMLKPFFDEWCLNNNLDYKTNSNRLTNDNRDNPFAWNWSYYTDNNGNNLTGSYRSIFDYFYDTVTPHTTPWEMLGFTIKPTWWDTEYGVAPYTSNNFKMWSDIANGYVRGGSNIGVQALFVRDGLLDIIPVDEFGDLLNPASIGLVKQFTKLPSGNVVLGNNSINGWNDDWEFGNFGPIETLWRTSSDFRYSVIQTFYKEKPAQVINDLWDTSTESNIFINRLEHSEIYVSGETYNNTVLSKTGINSWIADHLKSKGRNVTTNLGQPLRSLGINLAHRMGGFTKSDALTVYSDIYGEIPPDNVHVILHTNPTSTPTYSGVKIVYSNNKFQISGFDKNNCSFTYYSVDPSSAYTNISSINTIDPVFLPWVKNTYYAEGNIITYKGYWYECITSHTSSTLFEDAFWNQIAKPDINNSIYKKWFNTTTELNTINYGEYFNSLQDVVDFLNGLQTYYENIGWTFNSNTFKNSAIQFLTWFEENNTINNSYICLSPFEDEILYTLNSGLVNELKYPYFEMYDVNGKTINDFTETRSQTSLALQSSSIFYCKITVSVYEHILVLDNTTIYDDSIYIPSINVREERLLVDGFITTNWNGTLNAPGFIISGNTIIPNFEKTVDNIRKYFDIETVDNNGIQEYARKNIGYSKKDYLTELQITDTNQFEFYQGMIKQKGTLSAFDKLLRSSQISSSESISFSEEWAVRLGLYGNIDNKKVIELSLSNDDITFDPLLVTFNSSNIDNEYTFTGSFKNDSTITISNDSSDAELMTTSTVNSGGIPTNIVTKVIPDITATFVKLDVTTTDLYGNVIIKIGDDTVINEYPLQELSTYSLECNVTGSLITVIFQSNSLGEINLELTGYNNVINEPENTTKYLNINDVYDTYSNTFVIKDSHWLWRYDLGSGGPNWTKTIDKPLMPTAGYVNVEKMNYFCNTKNELLSVVSDQMSNYPTTTTTYSTTFTYDGISTSPVNVTNKLVPNKNTNGYSKINNIVVTLTNPLPSNGLVIEIGTVDTVISTINSQNLIVGSNTIYINEFISLDNTKNALYAKFLYQNLSPIGYNIDGITVSINVELFDVGSIQPNQNTWVYNNNNGDWATYKFQDTKLQINEVYPNSFSGQGAIVCLNSTPIDINTGDLVVISGSQSTATSGDLDQFDDYNTFNIETSNTVSSNITSNSTSQYILLQELSDAGMVIDSIVINNSISLTYDDNPTIITIGTQDDPEKYVYGYVPDTTFTPSNVMLYCDCCCSEDTTAPTEGTSVVTSSSCFNNNGVINISISNSSIVSGDTNTTIPIQITRTGDIFNNITSITVTNGGSGYTTAPNVTINGVSGYSATASINSSGQVVSISITNNNGCSIPSGTNPTVIIDAPTSGTTATATANITNVANVPTVVGWKYKDVTNGGDYIDGGTITFPVIDNSTGNEFWSQIIDFKYPSLDTSSHDYEIEIYDINDMGYTILNDTTTITIYNDVDALDCFDLSQIMKKTYSIGEVQDNDDIYVFITNKGTTNVTSGITVTVNYHYTKGFELFQNNTGFALDYESFGGSVLKWKETRFNSLDNITNPDGGWIENDIIHVDNNGNWVVYEYINNQWVEFFSYVNNYIDNSILNNVVLYTNNNSLTERFNVYDPLQDLIPGNIDRNITFKSKYDPAKYNSNNSNERNYWTKEHVGKTWWDLSSTYYVDYTLYGIDYTRDHWGEIVPNCDVYVYEWVRSPVSPTEWETYIASGTTSYNGFDSNPSGSVYDTTINYTLVSEWNNDINAYQDVYYFWVYNKSTLPNVDNRYMTSAQITNYIKNINDFDEPFTALTYGNNIIIGNISNSIKSENSTLKIVWNDGSENINQNHSEWALLRETDTINSVPSSLWSKFVESIVGYKKITKVIEHNGQTVTTITTSSTSVELSDVTNLLPSGDIRIGNYWFTYTSIINNTLYGLENPSNVKIVIGTQTYSKNSVTEYIKVPDSNLTTFEQYGTNNFPLQSIVPQVNNIPSRVVRQTLIDEINSILIETNYVDNVSNWNLLFNQTQDEPTIYSFSVDSLSELSGLTVTQGELVLVKAGLSTSNMWILYKYDPYNGSANSYGYVIQDCQLWNIEENYIWEYADWYSTGWSSDDTPQYTFATMSDKNSADIPDNTLLNGTLVQINQISTTDTRWTWQVYKDDVWTTVAIENGTFQLTDVFYNNTVVNSFDGYSLNNIEVRDGSFELEFLLNNFTEILTTEQMNEIYFAALRSILNTSTIYNDWLIKTSFMYIDGYQEQLNQTEIQPISQFDYIIEYIEEVKPYHVKIRDYLIQYVPELETLNTTITDFDFPNNSGTILRPQTEYGTYGYTNYSTSDTSLVQTTTPWSEWYDNYTNTVTDITKWDANWNGVRRFDVTIKIDNIGSILDEGWDISPWDFNIQTYSSNPYISDIETLKNNYTVNTKNLITVSRYYNLDELLLDSTFDKTTVVYVELENKYYFFNGSNWIEFYSGPWDKGTMNSTYDRIINLYEPTSTMNKDPLSLIDYYYKGTVWFCGNFSDGDWDQYPWDWYGGFDAEQSYYTGYEDQLSTNTTFSNLDGYITNTSENYLSRDLDVEAPDFDYYAVNVDNNNTENTAQQTGYGSVDILAWGSLFRDPEVEEGSTSEKVDIHITSSIIMKLNDNSTNNNIIFFKDYNDIWNIQNNSNNKETTINVNMYYNTGYSNIQTINVVDPSEVFLTYDIDNTNIVEIKTEIVYYDGENDIQYGNDISYILPTIGINGTLTTSNTHNIFSSNIASTSILTNNKSLYWLNNEIISAEYTSTDENGNTILYKVNRYLMGSSIPVISNNSYNEIDSSTIVYDNSTNISVCDFTVTFDPKNNTGFYNVTDNGIGLFGITLVEM